MKYAIEILEKDKKMLENALKGFNKEDYPEAFKIDIKNTKRFLLQLKY